MNLRVRSVTGCSAIFADSVVLLVKILDLVDVHVYTYEECTVGSLDDRASRVRPSVICVCAR